MSEVDYKIWIVYYWYLNGLSRWGVKHTSAKGAIGESSYTFLIPFDSGPLGKRVLVGM